MLLYVTLGSNDLDRAQLFYDATLATLGLMRRRQDDVEIGYAAESDTRCRLWVVTPHNRRPRRSAMARWSRSKRKAAPPSTRSMRQRLPMAARTRVHRGYGLFTQISMRLSSAIPMATSCPQSASGRNSAFSLI